jgi:hypothetical protein
MHPAHLQPPKANHSANKLRSIYGRSNSCYRRGVGGQKFARGIARSSAPSKFCEIEGPIPMRSAKSPAQSEYCRSWTHNRPWPPIGLFNVSRWKISSDLAVSDPKPWTVFYRVSSRSNQSV